MDTTHEKVVDGAAVLRVLTEERAEIVVAAIDAIRDSRTRYETAGEDEIRRRFEKLYDELLAAVTSRDLGGIVEYGRRLAAERFESGYDLSEVQSAFNALEVAAWSRLCARLQPEDLALSLGLVSTVLGVAKDALAQAYVSLASRTHVPSLDLSALFTGGAGA